MADDLKKKKVSELPEATDPTGFWIFGTKTINNVVTSVKFLFDNIQSLFGVTQEKGQSTTLAPSQKLFTNDSPLINVDKDYPLSSGFYTLATAIAVIPVDRRKSGLIITYLTDATSAETKQFNSNDISNFATETLWKDLGAVGSSLFNVTVEAPLSSGYYTPETARAAISSDKRKLGLIITYATSAKVWISEQYKGSDLSGWTNPDNWQAFGTDPEISKYFYHNSVVENSIQYNNENFVTTLALSSKIVFVGIPELVSGKIISLQTKLHRAPVGFAHIIVANSRTNWTGNVLRELTNVPFVYDTTTKIAKVDLTSYNLVVDNAYVILKIADAASTVIGFNPSTLYEKKSLLAYSDIANMSEYDKIYFKIEFGSGGNETLPEMVARLDADNGIINKTLFGMGGVSGGLENNTPDLVLGGTIGYSFHAGVPIPISGKIKSIKTKCSDTPGGCSIIIFSDLNDWKKSKRYELPAASFSYNADNKVVTMDLTEDNVEINNCYIAVKVIKNTTTSVLSYNTNVANYMKRTFWIGDTPLGATNTDWAIYLEIEVEASLSGGLIGEVEEIKKKIEDGDDEKVIIRYSPMMLTPIHGQSLALAIMNSIPAIHKTANSYCLMFNTGIYAVGATESSFTSLQALIEGIPTTNCETSSSGTSIAVENAMTAENKAWMLNSLRQVFITAGRDGGNIASQFGSYYQTIVGAMRALKTIVAYKEVKCPACYWIQGESDDNTDMNTYKDLLFQFRESLQRDAKIELAQESDVILITYQTRNASNKFYPAAQAQMELIRDNDLFAASCPVYILNNTDAVHITNWSQVLLGYYQGIAFKRTVIDHVPHKGVLPLSFNIRGNDIYIRFTCPFPPLKFDTSWVSAIANNGFEVIKSGSDIISSISLDEYDVVKISCTQSPAGATIRYAIQNNDRANRTTGNRGNLCDSQGEVYKGDINGVVVDLNNYCYAFAQTL